MILFVGDSITHGTNWSEWIDFSEVSNISIPGYLTDDVFLQLPEIAKLKPKVISLLIGTNDFGNPEVNRSGEEVGERVASIISRIISENNDVELVVNSILPRSFPFTERIKIANGIIAAAAGDRVKYLDCWPYLEDSDQLKDEYLLDDGFDAHLSEAGYAAWRSALLPVLKSLM